MSDKIKYEDHITYFTATQTEIGEKYVLNVKNKTKTSHLGKHRTLEILTCSGHLCQWVSGFSGWILTDVSSKKCLQF